MRRFTRLAVTAAFLAASGVAGLAQSTTTQPNPLRPAGSQKAAPTAPAAAPAPAPAPKADAKEAKPKRARSPAQLANDNRMRACGKEWRENKAKLTAAGKTWRVYNVECRARMKAAGQ